MKICVPVQKNEGLESVVYDHFGSAPLFLIYDTEAREIKEVKNGDLDHNHGMCQPIKALGGEAVNSVIVGGIGAGAISKLHNMGITVYRALNKTVQENIELLENDGLEEFGASHSCGNHDCGN